MAGLVCQMMVQEPIAAAIYYSYKEIKNGQLTSAPNAKNILVLDY